MLNNKNKTADSRTPLLIKDERGEYKFVTEEGDILLDDYLDQQSGSQAIKDRFSHSVAQASNRQQEIVQEIVKKSGLTISDELKKRLENTLISFLKEVRGEVATFTVLTQPASEGGLELDSEMADKIIALLKKNLPTHQAEQHRSVRGTVLDKKELASQSGKKNVLPMESNLDWTHELAPPPPVVRAGGRVQGTGFRERKGGSVSKPVTTISKSVPREQEEVIKVQKKSQRDVDIKTVTPKTDKKKVSVEGIKFKPHLIGPLDELKNLDLVEFQRLAKDPVASAQKIKDKIELLEKDSFAQKFKAIKAWRESKLNRLYLEIGEESMEHGESISDIIKKREQAGQPSLKVKEFEAIMELNSKLRRFS